MIPLGANDSISLAVGIPRNDLAVDADLANAAGNQLRVLGTKVEDQQTMTMNILCHALDSAHRSECLH